MNALDLLIVSLAAWRLAYLIVREDAPFRVMARLRARTTLGGLLTCIYCCSIWSAGGALILYQAGGVWQMIVFVLSVSAAALMLASYTGVNRPL